MAHFAKIENDIVQQVIVIDNQYENQGQEYINTELGLEGEWIQTSYNHNIRKQYAGVGYTYNREEDIFVRPKPYDSWYLDENYDWQPPIPYPDDGKVYNWNEELLDWELWLDI